MDNKKLIDSLGHTIYKLLKPFISSEKAYSIAKKIVTEAKPTYNDEDLPDEIDITWCVDDVKDMDKKLTDTECKKVLQIMKDKHDATIGINWDFIKECIYYYKDNK